MALWLVIQIWMCPFTLENLLHPARFFFRSFVIIFASAWDGDWLSIIIAGTLFLLFVYPRVVHRELRLILCFLSFGGMTMYATHLTRIPQ